MQLRYLKFFSWVEFYVNMAFIYSLIFNNTFTNITVEIYSKTLFCSFTICKLHKLTNV